MNKKQEVSFDVLREEALRFRFEAAAERRFPAREHAWPRTAEQEAVLKDALLRHACHKGLFKLNNGDYVLLGMYPEDMAQYLREHGEFPA